VYFLRVPQTRGCRILRHAFPTKKFLKADELLPPIDKFHRRSAFSEATDDELSRHEPDDRRCRNACCCDEEVTKQYHHDVSPRQSSWAPPRRVFLLGVSKMFAPTLRNEGGVNSTIAVHRSSGGRSPCSAPH
jgi:hypothetical protein